MEGWRARVVRHVPNTEANIVAALRLPVSVIERLLKSGDRFGGLGFVRVCKQYDEFIATARGWADGADGLDVR